MDRYELIQNDCYLLVSKDGHILESMNEVAICFDTNLGVRLSHGNPETVLEYYNDTIQRLKGVSFEEAIEDIVVIQGKFPVEELNKLLEDALYISTFVKRVTK